MFRDIVTSKHQRASSLGGEQDEKPKTVLGHARKPLSFHMPPPKEDGYSADDVYPSIVEVLHYMKRVFEDEALLDDLPLETAANPGAWHAWRAHRRKAKLSKSPQSHQGGHGRSTSVDIKSASKSKPTGNWNWDGVWAERVKKGINASLSDQMLYSSVDGDDLVGNCRTAPGLTLNDIRSTSWKRATRLFKGLERPWRCKMQTLCYDTPYEQRVVPRFLEVLQLTDCPRPLLFYLQSRLFQGFAARLCS